MTWLRSRLDEATQELRTTQQKLDQATKDLASTSSQLDQTREDLDAARSRVDELQRRLDELNEKLQTTADQLRLASSFDEFRFTGYWALTLKNAASLSPSHFTPLSTIVRLYSVPWKLGGLSPQEGFDSPSFAAYVLEQNGLLPVPAADARSHLRDVLRPRHGPPQVGDVVFYEAGYTMFYFRDEENQPFVIGMTPLGVMALKPEFAPVIGTGTPIGQ